LHEKVASPSTATPKVTESISARNAIVLPPCAVSVSETGDVAEVDAIPIKGISKAESSIDPVNEPVTSPMPIARLRVAFVNPVMSVVARVKFAVHDLMIPPIQPDIATFPATPLIPAIVILL